MNPSTSVRMPGGETCPGGFCKKVSNVLSSNFQKKKYNIGKAKVKSKSMIEEPESDIEDDNATPKPVEEKMGIKIVNHSAGEDDEVKADNDNMKTKTKGYASDKEIDEPESIPSISEKKINPKVKKALGIKSSFYQKAKM